MMRLALVLPAISINSDSVPASPVPGCRNDAIAFGAFSGRSRVSPSVPKSHARGIPPGPVERHGEAVASSRTVCTRCKTGENLSSITGSSSLAVHVDPLSRFAMEASGWLATPSASSASADGIVPSPPSTKSNPGNGHLFLLQFLDRLVITSRIDAKSSFPSTVRMMNLG